jgi:hypothetical protein
MTQTDNALVEIEAAMAELGKELGNSLSFDDRNVCVFRYLSDLDVAIQVFPEDKRITFAAVLKDDVDPGTEGLFPLLAMFNWMGIHTRGGTVCFNDDSRSIVLWRDPVCTRWDGEILRSQLEDFIGLAIELREKLEEGLSALSEALSAMRVGSTGPLGGTYA